MGELQTAATELVEVNLGDINLCPNDAEDNISNNHNNSNNNNDVSNTNKSNEDHKDIFRNGSINHNNIINSNENTSNNNSNNDNTNNNNNNSNMDNRCSNNNNNNNSNMDNSYNRFSSDSSQLTTSSKKPMISNKKELKQLRKPSDRIQSKSYCATFCYNIPRSSLMITIPGFIILATGAILIAAADRDASWTEGGMLLVSLVFLIVGGFWTLGGLIYWLITWCKYKPNVVKRSQTSSTRPVMTSSATSSSAFNNGYPSNSNIPLSISPSTSTPTVFETVNSPFTVIPHPIFSQQQLRQSQELNQNQQPIAAIQSQQIQYQQYPSKYQSAQQTYSENIQQELTRQQQNARQTSQQLQQNLSNHQQNIRKEVSHLNDDVTNSAQQQQQQRVEDGRHNSEENLDTSFYY